MTVEAVLRYMKSNSLVPLPQYTIGDCPNHFFKCDDIRAKVGEKEFRIMECEVITHMVIQRRQPKPELEEKD